MSIYGISKKVDLPFKEAKDKVISELANEGFGILTEIDVKDKMREKLGKDMGNYIILGACNPALAYEALQKEQEIGLLLPCNVIVYEKDGVVFVSALKPLVALSIADNPDLTNIATIAEQKLTKVINNI